MAENEKKKILVVDDSALMRRVLCDIINSDKRFQVVAKAVDGIEAFDLLSKESYDAVVMDINMPRMNGLEVLRELKKFKIPARVMIASTDSKEGAAVTMDALELGALDFIQKPGTSFECRSQEFMSNFLDTLYAVSQARLPLAEKASKAPFVPNERVELPKRSISAPVKPAERSVQIIGSLKPAGKGNHKIVAIASSTGGPRALQSVIPKLPKNLDAPVVLVQHMPKGFTASLAERLDSISEISVKEAKEGEVLENGTVYIAMGGKHLNVILSTGGKHIIHYSDEPTREGVKPCANYMYESLLETRFSDVLCVVMTGMGADGTDGIRNLKNGKRDKNIAVLAQNQNSCVVYGMPKSVTVAGLSDQETELRDIAGKITEWVGKRS